MAKTALTTSLLVLVFCAFSQGQDQYIRFAGKILSTEDSSEVVASMRYEKLPYYDDMGMAKSSESGDFELYLLKQNKYSMEITSQGYLSKTIEVELLDEDGDGEQITNYYLEADPEMAVPELITLENLIFNRSSDVITQSSYEELDQLASWLRDNPGTIIQLEGHTDFAGNADANMRLSQARVDAVKEYLTDQGVKKQQVMTKAFGGTQPLTEERTDEAQARNRRVEVRVISQ